MQAAAARQVGPNTVVGGYGKGNPGQPGHQVMMAGGYPGQPQQQRPIMQQQQQQQHGMMPNMGQPMNQQMAGPMGKPNAMVQQHLMQNSQQQQGVPQQQQPNRTLPGMEQVWNRCDNRCIHIF